MRAGIWMVADLATVGSVGKLEQVFAESWMLQDSESDLGHLVERRAVQDVESLL